ncbi:uncharacterized protein LOC111915237 [Lactuca sativa]|uniref:DUF1985 domain-containing protein n=1 Tax=Lactuca sativa TaxID=4236 RepID=A0A9R1WK12_LACSA|nr:uncharacterized protein LOC111915237 [Lactuca sativa]KAJ0225418.1 hypothetical protein LSAT_V11C100021690 [Lactuca sativa]
MTHLQNRPVCGVMFRQSCFGDYVNMPMGIECHPLLCHYLMCKEFTTFDPIDIKAFIFPVSDYHVCFDRKALCLVTGLRFGEYFPPSFGFAEFRERMFPFVSLSRSVSMNDLMHMFNNLLHQLSNEDMVRDSLLYILEHGFLGKYPQQPVTNERMTLVYNLNKFNRYSWGRVIWDFTYKEMCTVFDKIKDHLSPNTPRVGSRHTYTLQGFVYAFKIWIMETFPNSRIVGSPIPSVIPRAVSYPRMRRLQLPDCQRILNVTNICSL